MNDLRPPGYWNFFEDCKEEDRVEHVLRYNADPKKSYQEHPCLAPNLLCINTEKPHDEAFYRELIESTAGRLVPDWCRNSKRDDEFGAEGHLFDIEKLSIEVQRKYRHSQELLNKQGADSDDPTIINEWESLYGCEI